jgi:hypothetical protein
MEMGRKRRTFTDKFKAKVAIGPFSELFHFSDQGCEFLFGWNVGFSLARLKEL